MNVEANDVIHDCFLEFFEGPPSETEIQSTYDQLPPDIHHLASQWGWNDTVVGDKIFIWIKENIKLEKLKK